MYCCTRKSGEKVHPTRASVRIKDGTYAIKYLNPSDLTVLGEAVYESKNLRLEGEITLPPFQDDILVVITGKNLKKRSLMDDTL